VASAPREPQLPGGRAVMAGWYLVKHRNNFTFNCQVRYISFWQSVVKEISFSGKNEDKDLSAAFFAYRTADVQMNEHVQCQVI
jgi:hypothetical protein